MLNQCRKNVILTSILFLAKKNFTWNHWILPSLRTSQTPSKMVTLNFSFMDLPTSFYEKIDQHIRFCELDLVYTSFWMSDSSPFWSFFFNLEIENMAAIDQIPSAPPVVGNPILIDSCDFSTFKIESGWKNFFSGEIGMKNFFCYFSVNRLPMSIKIK